jgi:DivIVA domain-containing protein
MYLLITVIAALLVGLVLVSLVQTTFGRPEEAAESMEDSDGPRFRVVRRGYDIAEVDRYLDTLQDRGHDRSMTQE